MNAEGLADLMLQQVWKLHGTPKTIVLDRGSIFLSQITKEIDQQLGIRLHPSTAYHPRTDGVVIHLRSKCQEALPKYSIYIYIV
jgi:transposase InsO family protein